MVYIISISYFDRYDILLGIEISNGLRSELLFSANVSITSSIVAMNLLAVIAGIAIYIIAAVTMVITIIITITVIIIRNTIIWRITIVAIRNVSITIIGISSIYIPDSVCESLEQ